MKKPIPLNSLKRNKKNPRKISESALLELCTSIERDPEFMELRPIVVDENNIILGGNQRYSACVKLGKKNIPATWVKVATNITEDQRKRFVLIDNSLEGMSGEWDFEILESDWDVSELTDIGFDLDLLNEQLVIERPDGDNAGSSPWDRIGEASDGIMFSFGAIQKRVPVELYDTFIKSVSVENVERWINESINH